MIRTRAIAVFGVVLACASNAGASPTYPQAIQGKLGTPCPPVCTLCHETMQGGATTANTPFGIQVRRRPYSLVSGDTEKLFTVLDQLEANATDIDGDGVTDIAELKAGTDPNVLGDTPLDCYTPPPPAGDDGGCAIGPALTGDAAGFVAVLFGWLLLRRRRQPVL